MKKGKVLIVLNDKDGKPANFGRIEGRFFNYSIGGKDFEFCHHRKWGDQSKFTITHARSGRSLCTVGSIQTRSAIKELDQFLQALGVEKIYKTLTEVETNITKPAAYKHEILRVRTVYGANCWISAHFYRKADCLLIPICNTHGVRRSQTPAGFGVAELGHNSLHRDNIEEVLYSKTVDTAEALLDAAKCGAWKPTEEENERMQQAEADRYRRMATTRKLPTLTA